MKNTGVTYSSTERTPTVLPEMAERLPPLSEEQLSAAMQALRSETPAVYPKGFCLLPCSTVAGSRTLPAFLLPAGSACIKAAGKTQ